MELKDKDFNTLKLIGNAKETLLTQFLCFIILPVLCLMQLIAAYMIYNGKVEIVKKVKQTCSITETAKQPYIVNREYQACSITITPEQLYPVDMIKEEKLEKADSAGDTVETSSIPVVVPEGSAGEKDANIPPKDNVLGSACKEVSECPKKNFQNGKRRGKGKKGQSANQSNPKSTPAGSKGK